MISHVFTEYVTIDQGKAILDRLQIESPEEISIKFITKQPSETIEALSEYAKLLWPMKHQLRIEREV